MTRCWFRSVLSCLLFLVAENGLGAQQGKVKPIRDQKAELDLYPNFNTIGVNVKLVVDDPERDASAELRYGIKENDLAPGFPLSRVDNEFKRLSGCIFWCKPGRRYFVHVKLKDPTTPAIDGLELTGSAITRKISSNIKTVKTLYVKPNGVGIKFSRKEPGALATALQQVQPGTRVVLLKGRYLIGGLRIAKSGTKQQPIVLEGESRADVVLDGSQKEKLVWKATKNKGVFVSKSKATNPNLIVADGKRLFPHQSMTDLKGNQIAIGITTKGIVRFPAELDGFYRNPSSNPLLNSNWQSPNSLYIKFRDNSDPNKHQIKVAQQNRALTANGCSNLVLRNMQFHCYARSPAGTALQLANCKDVVIDNCDFAYNDISLKLQGHCENITIQNSEFRDGMQGWHAWKMKSTYDLYAPFSSVFPALSRMLERGGIIYQHGFSGRGIVIRHCKFHDFAQAGQICPPSINRRFKDSYEIDFHDNVVWNCAEDGFELDADSRNVRIWKNTFHHCNASISMATAQCGPTYVVRNLFHSIVKDVFTIRPEDGLKIQPGHPFKFQTGDAKSRIGDLVFVHNTIHAPNEAYALDLNAPARWKRFYGRNNLFVSEKGPAIVVNSFEPFPIDLDYNLFYSSAGRSLGRVDRNYRDKTPVEKISTINQLQKWGWERHGISSNPRFVDAKKKDFHLRPQSPAIDKGVIVNGINDSDYAGDAPDLGAFEAK